MDAYDIKDYIIRQFRPSCIVFASAGAKLVCKENNLSPAELLRPFADMRKDQLTISTSEKVSYFLKDFILDFYDYTDYDKTPASTHIKARHQILRNNPPNFNFSEPLSVDPRELKTRKTNWFDLWKNSFLELNRCQFFESLQQPFATFALVSGEEPILESVQSIMYFFHFTNLIRKNMPEICLKQYEMDFPKILIILETGTAPKPATAYEPLRKSLSAYKIYVIPINSCILYTSYC